MNLLLGSRGFGKAATFCPTRRHFCALQAAKVDEEAVAGRQGMPPTGPPLRSSSPYLMVPPGLVAEGDDHKLVAEEEVEPDDKDYYHLFNVADKEVVKIKQNLRLQWQREILLPADDDALCVGSSHGWLAFINQRNCALYLFNPLIDPYSVFLPFIPLPPIETFPSVISSVRRRRKSTTDGSSSSSIVTEYMCRERMSDVSSKDLSELFIKRLVLSSAPSLSPSPSNQDCIVMAIQGEDYELAFCRLGDTAWTPLDGPLKHYEELVYFSKDQRFYALSNFGSIEAWDLRNPASPKTTLIISALPPIVQPFMDEHQRQLRIDSHGFTRYLVESSGDLLMAIRYSSHKVDDNGNIIPEGVDVSAQPYKTLQFDVYKLDFAQKKWIYVPSLGDRVFFVGLNHSVSLSSRDFPGLRGNSIYFTCLDAEVMEDSYGGHDLGVFNLEDKTIIPFYQCDFKKIRPPPTWIIPQL